MSNSSSSQDLPRQIRYFGMAYFPALMLIGCLSNIMVIRVMRRTRGMSKSRDVFTLLAVADTCVLLVNPSRYFVQLATNYDFRLYTDAACVVHTFLTYFLKEAATWILVLMTLERFLFAKWPHKSSLFYRRRSKLVLWSCSLLALLAKNVVLIFKLGVIPSSEGSSAKNCDTGDQNFRLAFFITTLSLYSLIPFVLLTVFNVTLIRIIARANRRRQQMSMTTCNRQNQQQHQQHQQQQQALRHKTSTASQRPSNVSGTHVNRLLVPVCIMHILLTMPQCVFEIIETIYKLKSDPSQRGRTYTVGLSLVMLASLNNGINGFVYFFSSENFRKNFCQIFHRGVESGGSGGAAFCRSTGRNCHRQGGLAQPQPRPMRPVIAAGIDEGIEP